ncbi:MAG: hypothetical protein AAFV38_11085, partial [Pseudomonadota bacterium]
PPRPATLTSGSERHLLAMQLAFDAAKTALNTAQNEAAATVRKVEQKRNAAREAFVGARHARVAVEDIIREMVGLDDLITKAEGKVADAEKAVVDAAAPVAAAQQALQAARLVQKKRDTMLQQTQWVAQRARDLVIEAEAEEQWVGQQGYGRLP